MHNPMGHNGDTEVKSRIYNQVTFNKGTKNMHCISDSFLFH